MDGRRERKFITAASAAYLNNPVERTYRKFLIPSDFVVGEKPVQTIG
jgi:hypothetical protein